MIYDQVKRRSTPLINPRGTTSAWSEEQQASWVKSILWPAENHASGADRSLPAGNSTDKEPFIWLMATDEDWRPLVPVWFEDQQKVIATFNFIDGDISVWHPEYRCRVWNWGNEDDPSEWGEDGLNRQPGLSYNERERFAEPRVKYNIIGHQSKEELEDMLVFRDE